MRVRGDLAMTTRQMQQCGVGQMEVDRESTPPRKPPRTLLEQMQVLGPAAFDCCHSPLRLPPAPPPSASRFPPSAALARDSYCLSVYALFPDLHPFVRSQAQKLGAELKYANEKIANLLSKLAQAAEKNETTSDDFIRIISQCARSPSLDGLTHLSPTRDPQHPRTPARNYTYGRVASALGVALSPLGQDPTCFLPRTQPPPLLPPFAAGGRSAIKTGDQLRAEMASSVGAKAAVAAAAATSEESSVGDARIAQMARQVEKLLYGGGAGNLERTRVLWAAACHPEAVQSRWSF